MKTPYHLQQNTDQSYPKKTELNNSVFNIRKEDTLLHTLNHLNFLCSKNILLSPYSVPGIVLVIKDVEISKADKGTALSQEVYILIREPTNINI